jgi:DDE superfamily endonuclease
VLNRARWSARAVAGVLLGLLVAASAPSGPVVIGADDTLERRWGRRIAARDIYRDAVRSSHGHFANASGLRWVSLSLLAPIPWADRVWALPFLTALAPSERYARGLLSASGVMERLT